MKGSRIRCRFLLSVLIVFVTVGFIQLAAAAEAVPGKAAPAKQTRVSDAEKAGYWFRKGALCATYGNDRAAIAYFNKALALNPGHRGAHFSKGVSYGQLGHYQKALDAIDKAIALEPGNGHFYYGRGRVQLLAGRKSQAMLDFRKAADLGDEDAQIYLGDIDAPSKIILD
jgi:tetratricopeptide (TPR) repeat protein